MAVASESFFATKRFVLRTIGALLLLTAGIYFFPPKALYSFQRFLDFKFRTSTYAGRIEILRTLFKPGDTRSYVDGVLASISDYPPNAMDDAYVRYDWRRASGKGTYGVIALYDKDLKLLAMQTLEGGVFNDELLEGAYKRILEKRSQQQ